MTDALALMRFLADPAAYRDRLEALEARRADIEDLVRNYRPQLEAVRELDSRAADLAERERRLTAREQVLDAERAALDVRRTRLEAALQS